MRDRDEDGTTSMIDAAAEARVTGASGQEAGPYQGCAGTRNASDRPSA